MSMRTLIWKDYRQNRKVLVGIAIILAMPYVVTLLGYPLFSRNGLWEHLPDRIGLGAIFALMLSAGMTAFLSGNAMAGERADRSAEFAAYLPIRRRNSLISKVVFATVVSSGLFLLNLAVIRVASPHGFQNDFMSIARNLFASAVLLFGVAWLFSAVTSSPAMSAAAGLAALPMVAGTLAVMDIKKRPGVGQILEHPFDWYPSICIAIGVAAFLAGCLCYLLRKTP